MMIAAKQMDPVMGVDIHMVIPPAPVPVPVPIPHPFIGMVFDPMEFLPFLGASVWVNCMPAAIAATECKNIPPHIPIGGPFAPPPPGNEGEIFMGSSTVAFDGEAASHLLHPVLTCQSVGMPSPPRPKAKKKSSNKSMMLPLSMVLAIPMGAPVLIGGPPTISLMAMGMKVAMAGLGKAFKKFKASKLGKKLGQAAKDAGAKLKKAKKKLFKNMKPGFVKCKILKAEPVNAITGEVVVEQQDFSIPGRIPFEWGRTWGSQSEYKGVCGNGWETPADMRLEIDPDGNVSFYDGTPGATLFPEIPQDKESVVELFDGAKLHRQNDWFFVTNKSGITYQFSKIKQRIRRNRKETICLNIEQIRDTSGNYLAFIRNARGELMRIQESAGRSVEVKCSGGLIRQMVFRHPEYPDVKPLLKYEYSDNGNLLAVYDALDNPYRFAYKNDLMVSHTDRNGLSFYYDYDVYDKTGKCIHAWGDGNLYNYHFEYLPNETAYVDSLGNKKSLIFNDDFLPTAEQDDQGNVLEAYEYDDMGRTSAVIDGGGNKTKFEHDNFGNIIKLTRPDGTEVLSEYDTNHNVVNVTDPSGNQWRQEWNNRGLLEKQITPLGNETSYFYNAQGEIACTVNPKGFRTTLSSDKYGNPTALVDAMQNCTRFAVDELGNITNEVGPTGKETRYFYDAKNRIARIVNPSGTKIDCAFDGEDNLTHYRDEAGHVTKLEYTGIGEVGKRHQPDGTVVQYHWDTEEQLIGVTNERGQRYELVRDAKGQIIEEIDYWKSSRKYTYNAAGHLVESIDPLGRTTQFDCDPFGRLKSKTLFDGVTETYEFDVNGNLAAHKNQNIECRRQFDVEGKLLEEKQGDFTVSYAYDKNGNRIHRKTSHGNEVDIEFDALDEVIAVSINKQPSVEIQKDAEGLPTKEILSGIIERDYEYNKDGLLTRQNIYASTIQLAERTYTYDPVGNLTSRTDGKKGTTYFSYDPMGRINKSVNPKQRIEQHLYDPAGDLLKSDHQFDDQKEVRVSIRSGVEYHHNKAGNLVQRHGPKGTATFDWDGNDRIAKAVNENGQNVQMSYDAQGRRLSKETGGKRTKFAWDGDRLLSDDKPGRGLHEYVYYPGTYEPLAFIDKRGDTYYFQNDNIGLPQEITNEYGRVVWSASYGTFGVVEEQYVNEMDNPIRFQGQYYDEEIDLSYNRFRYYDPNAGCFVSQDPLGLAPSANVYKYAPNYWMWIDPLGLACKRADIKALQTGPRGTVVTVKTRKDAEELVKAAFPDYEKMAGIGRTSAKGRRRSGKLDRYRRGKVYHKDYAIDPKTNRPIGHNEGKSWHSGPHIDINRGNKIVGKDEVHILITG